MVLEIGRSQSIGLVQKEDNDRLFWRRLEYDTTLLAVIDGLNGQPGGGVAADIVMGVLADVHEACDDPPALLRALMDIGNEKIMAYGSENSEFSVLGCCATFLYVAGSAAYWLHVGDCRLYWYAQGLLDQVTVDQNLAQELVDEGKLSQSGLQNHPLRHFVSQCLGEEGVVPQTGQLLFQSGESLLLCSDGLHGMVDNESIASILAGEECPARQADMLCCSAMEAGGRDNISILLLKKQK